MYLFPLCNSNHIHTIHKLYFNPTDDECTRHATLTACYQLAQSVLKIGSALAERVGQGEVGGHSHDMPCTWRLSWLAVEKPCSALAWPFLSFFLHK